MSEAAKRMRQTYAVTGDRWFLIAAEQIERQSIAIADAIEAIERGSTSAPVLEVLKAVQTEIMTVMTQPLRRESGYQPTGDDKPSPPTTGSGVVPR